MTENGADAPSLRSYADRLETLMAEKQALLQDIRDLCTEAKLHDIHVQALKEVVKRRLESPEKHNARTEQEETLERYLAALGMLGELPLGQAALARRVTEERAERAAS